MALKRTMNRIPIDGISFKVVVKYYSEDAPTGTYLYKMVQLRFLHDLMDNPGLLDCGNQPFEKMQIFHDGNGWVAELEAIST